MILDSGDTFFPPNFKSYKNPELLIKGADYIIDILNVTDLDVANVGDNDLIAGNEYILKRTHAAKFPIISANLKYEESGDLLFLPYIIKEVNGLKLGIFGLVTNKVKLAPGLAADDPFQTAKEVVKELRDRCDLIIALTHLGVYDDEKLAKEVPNINVIVGGHCGTELSTPLKIGNTIILNDYIQCRYLGQLDLTIRNGSLDFFDATSTGNSGDLLAVEKANNVPENEFNKDIMGKSYYVNALAPMDESISDDPEIASIIDEYNRYKIEYMKSKFISSKTNGEN